MIGYGNASSSNEECLLLGVARSLAGLPKLMVTISGRTVHSEDRIPLVAGARQAGGYLGPDWPVDYQYF